MATIPVSGRTETVDSTTGFFSWNVTSGGRLNVVDGARTAEISLKDSALDIRNGVVEGDILLVDSQARIQDARITSLTKFGLIVGSSSFQVFKNPYAEMHNSAISGLGVAISIGVLGTLQLFATNAYGSKAITYEGIGIKLSGSNVEIYEGSHIVGETHGITILEGAGVATGSRDYSRPDPSRSRLVIDGSTIEGQQGAAIRAGVGRVGTDLPGAVADITVRNHSRLLSGNGRLLEVHDRSQINFRVDDSVLVGDLIANETSILDVTLQNHASLTGNIINGNNLALTSGGYWQMAGDNSVKALNMDGGAVSFGEGGFKTLSLNQLSGNGNFSMRVNLDHGMGDLLQINGQASGQFGLRVQNTGLEVVSPDLQPLRVVHTEGGDAQFSLIGDRVDLGVYSYGLEQQGNDWYIVGSDRTISPSAASALALFNAAPVIWMGELSTLRSRMGEVRSTGLGGGWMRAYGNRFDASTSDGVDYRHRQQGFSLGADAPVPVSNGQLSLGVLAGHSQSDLDLSHGTSGTVDSVYVGAYGTWLAEQGYYLDAVLKLNRMRNKAKVAMSDSTRTKGDYHSTGLGASVELGRHVRLDDGWFVEPYTQLAVVDIKGEGYRMDNGLRARNSHTRSLLAKAGATLGRDIALKDGGVLQPYVRIAAAQEFSRDNEVKVNNRRFDNQLSGSRAEIGAGVSVSLSERLQLHADFDYMNGKRVEQPWGANVGLRFAF